jgi:hypothetical protein
VLAGKTQFSMLTDQPISGAVSKDAYTPTRHRRPRRLREKRPPMGPAGGSSPPVGGRDHRRPWQILGKVDNPYRLGHLQHRDVPTEFVEQRGL